MIFINPGKLNKRVIIQKEVSSNPLDDTEYIDYKKVWASISNIHGKEFLEAQRVNPKISKKVTVRYIKELDPSINKNSCKDYKVKYKDQVYNILYIDNIKEENKYMELLLEII